MRNCISPNLVNSPRVALTRVRHPRHRGSIQLSRSGSCPVVSRYVQGLIDVPFLNLTPGTRSGIIQDERYAALIDGTRAPGSARQRTDRGATARRRRTSEPAVLKGNPEGRFTRPCSRCRAKNTTGSTFRVAHARKGGSPADRMVTVRPAALDWEDAVPGRRRSRRPVDVTAATVLRLRGSAYQCRRLAGCEHHAAQRDPQV